MLCQLKEEKQTSLADNKKKNNGSTKTATMQDMTKNLFHPRTILASGFTTPRTYGCRKEQVLLNHPLASPYRTLWSCRKLQSQNCIGFVHGKKIKVFYKG